MNSNLQKIMDKRVERTAMQLEKNNIKTHYVKTKEALHQCIKAIVPVKGVVSVGGSMTLFETDTLSLLRNGDYTFLDRYEDGLQAEDIRKIYLESFNADAYFASANAITEDGLIYNVDGNGNRVAAIAYGPKKVVLVVGTNKIVKDLPAAIERNRSISAPTNCLRLATQTPCVHTGKCEDCTSPERICCTYTVTGYQRQKERIHVIFVDGNYGF